MLLVFGVNVPLRLQPGETPKPLKFLKELLFGDAKLIKSWINNTKIRQKLSAPSPDPTTKQVSRHSSRHPSPEPINLGASILSKKFPPHFFIIRIF
jgi:hypothetical protein